VGVFQYLVEGKVGGGKKLKVEPLLIKRDGANGKDSQKTTG